MKKAYKTAGILFVAVMGTYALLACNTAANKAPDELPVDLSAPAEKAVSTGEGTISVADFDKTIKGDKLTMVDFYTTWCGPCKMMAPDVVKIKKEKSDLVNVMQIDAEKQEEISSRYNITAYPTLMFFKRGQVVQTVVGLQTYEQLTAQILKLK